MARGVRCRKERAWRQHRDCLHRGALIPLTLQKYWKLGGVGGKAPLPECAAAGLPHALAQLLACKRGSWGAQNAARARRVLL